MSNMNFEKFKTELVKIEYLENYNGYNGFGHNPLQLIAIDEFGEMELNALCGLKVKDIINRVHEYLNSNTKELYLSMDFPANQEISNDFVFLIHIANHSINSTLIIEYDTNDGKIIKESDGTGINGIKYIIDKIIPRSENIHSLRRFEI